MSAHEDGYLVHKAGRGWYKPEAKGYTLSADEAGRFTLTDALSYAHPNGPDGPRDGITYKHESEIKPHSDYADDLRIHDLTAERNVLLAANEELSQSLSAAYAEIEGLKAQLRGYQSATDIIAGLYV